MPFAETAKFPSAVAAVGDLLNHKNIVSTTPTPTLASSITSGSMSISLSAGTGAGLPADNFVFCIDNEIILISSRSTDTLTVATSGRGYEGTTAAAHNAGATGAARITAKAHNQLAVEINAIETALGASLANVLLPAAKGAANGVAQLDASTLVPTAQLGTGTANSGVFLRGDRTWAAPSFANLSGNPTMSQLGSGTPNSSVYLRGDGTWAAAGGAGAITSVFGRTGVVVATTGDYSFSQISGNPTMAQLGSGTPSISTFLRGDGSWASPTTSGAELVANKDTASGYAGLDANTRLKEAQVGVFPKYCNFVAVNASASVTSAQNLMLYTIPAGYMDVLTRALRVQCGGFYSTSVTACNMTLALVLISASTMATITFAVPGSQADKAWMAEFILVRTSTGVSGELSSLGRFVCEGATGPAQPVYGHREWTNDMTVARDMRMQVTYSVASASNSCWQTYMIVERLNY